MPPRVKRPRLAAATRWIASVALAAALLPVPSAAEAKPPIFRTWAQVHGAVANGQARYFGAENGPYVGYGGQIGLAVLFFEVFYDANVFDPGKDPGETSPTMWNQLGLGLNVPFDITDAIRVFGRADVSWVQAPFDGGPGSGSTSGFATRGGAGVEYVFQKFFALGTGLYGGYQIFGARDRNDNGSYFMGQLYGRFELRL